METTQTVCLDHVALLPPARMHCDRPPPGADPRRGHLCVGRKVTDAEVLCGGRVGTSTHKDTMMSPADTFRVRGLAHGPSGSGLRAGPRADAPGPADLDGHRACDADALTATLRLRPPLRGPGQTLRPCRRPRSVVLLRSVSVPPAPEPFFSGQNSVQF